MAILHLLGDKVQYKVVPTGSCVKEWREARETCPGRKSVNVRCRQGALCSLNFTAKSSASDRRRQESTGRVGLAVSVSVEEKLQN